MQTPLKSTPLSRFARNQPVAFIVAAQTLVTLLASLVAAGWGPSSAIAVALGCCCYGLPTALFVLYAFRVSPERLAQSPHLATWVVQSFYRGQANKLALTALCFAAAFVLIEPLSVLAFMTGYCVMIPAHWVVSMFVSNALASTGD
jgi:F0F1-type ATP synthase assembly protein I